MPCVLVVEDSPTQAKRLAIVLEEAGFDVQIAPDAETALRLLPGCRIEMVLSDLHLPGDSGFDLCRRMKSDPTFRRTPVVVCTSEADPVNVLRGLEAGADGFFSKERDPDAIVGCLRRVLARPSSSAPVVRTTVDFLDHQFELSAGRDQLIDVLVSSFEDVVNLSRRHQANALALRELNRQLGERNRELQRLADSERQAHEDLKRAESQLVQAEKLSALGQMVAGVAHEINNPLAFVTNNLTVLAREFVDLREVVRLWREAEPTLARHDPERIACINEYCERIDLAYTLETFDRLLGRTQEGLKRIQQIVVNLRNFARLDEHDLKEVDLNEGILCTVNVIQSQANQRQVELRTELQPLPLVTCYPAKINQVVLNLVANAIDACVSGGEVVVCSRPGPPGDGVVVEVADTGSGIEPAILEKIFDPFFTTKPQGKGTGLGLSISYGIVQAHGGRIDVESTVGTGSRFLVSLPLRPPADA